MRRFAAIALALVACGLSAHDVRAASSEFSRTELRKLAAGELVTRPVEKRRGEQRLIGGSSWQVIDAPIEVVWKAVLDTQHYHRMLPEVDEARIVQHRPGKRTVFMRHEAGLIEASYYLDVSYDERSRDVRFRVDPGRPHDLRAAWGVYAVRPYGKDRSLLAFRIMADLDGGLLSMLVEGVVHEWMLKVPWTIKRFVEGSGKHVYAY